MAYRRRRKRRGSSPFPWLRKGLLILFLALSLVGGICYAYLHHQKISLLKEREALLEKQRTLERQIARLKSDPRAYEEIARQKYGLIKDNERLIIFRR